MSISTRDPNFNPFFMWFLLFISGFQHCEPYIKTYIWISIWTPGCSTAGIQILKQWFVWFTACGYRVGLYFSFRVVHLSCSHCTASVSWSLLTSSVLSISLSMVLLLQTHWDHGAPLSPRRDCDLHRWRDDGSVLDPNGTANSTSWGKHSGSLTGKSGNIERDYAGAHSHFMMKYFWPSNQELPGSNSFVPVQPESSFERRFEMSRQLFNLVRVNVFAQSEYLRKGLRPDAMGRIGITPLLKVTFALRKLAYGLPSDLGDDIFDILETTASFCLT